MSLTRPPANCREAFLASSVIRALSYALDIAENGLDGPLHSSPPILVGAQPSRALSAAPSALIAASTLPEAPDSSLAASALS